MASTTHRTSDLDAKKQGTNDPRSPMRVHPRPPRPWLHLVATVARRWTAAPIHGLGGRGYEQAVATAAMATNVLTVPLQHGEHGDAGIVARAGKQDHHMPQRMVIPGPVIVLQEQDS